MDKLSKRKSVSFLPLWLQVWMMGYYRICWKVYLNPYLTLFTHHSSLRHPFYRVALKLCISKEAARYFKEHVCADKFCADKFHHFSLIAVSPPTSFTPPPLSKEQIPPVWATPLRLLWNRLPLWQKGKEKKVYPAQPMSFAPIHPSIYPSDFQRRNWHLRVATTTLQTMQKKIWEKQITTHKAHMTYYLQKSYTIFPPPSQTI